MCDYIINDRKWVGTTKECAAKPKYKIEYTIPYNGKNGVLLCCETHKKWFNKWATMILRKTKFDVKATITSI